MPDTWDITPSDPGYSGPRITLYDRGGDVSVARADDPRVDPWVLVPVTLLQYIDGQCIRVNGDRDAAAAYNSALEGAFPDGPPGGCGGPIDMPDLVTEAQLIEEGAAFDMGAYGYAEFHGETVRTVSDTLFAALQNAFRLAATAAIGMTEEQIYADALAGMEGEHGRDPEYVEWVRGLGPVGCRSIMGIVPFWANLGELLEVLIGGARDTAEPGEPQGSLYATPPMRALRDRPVWLQRPRAGEWTAFFPEDY